MSYAELKVKCAEALTGAQPPASTSGPVNGQNAASIFAALADTNATEQSLVLNWVNLADAHINNHVQALVLPLNGKMKYEEKSYKLNETEFDKLCAQLNSKLVDKRVLVGEAMTVADSTVAAALKPAFESVLGEAERAKLPHLTAWYEATIAEAKVKKHLKTAFVKEKKPFNAEEVAAKLAKEEEKARKKAEKEAKFAAKKAAQAKKAPAKDKPKKEEKKEKAKDIVEYTEKTAKGAKKSTTCQLPKAYSPKYVEAAWGEWWEKEGMFKPEYGREDVYADNPEGHFTIMIPPPNVTGTLHLGHGLTLSVQDAIVRWHRMNGKTTLWNPGCDHAGIATQVVVEKKLKREKGLSRHDLGREAFVDEIWKWRNEKGDNIYNQVRKMGASVDWDRAAFTMDPKLYRAVQTAFCRMHERGVIYRSNRLVNWSCALQSAISNIEVDSKDLEGRTLLSVPGYADKIEFGVIVSFSYKLASGAGEIIVATTRIETMLGDVAIAVHPEDKRYAALVGQKCKHPFIPSRELIIVADDYVKMDFGTGAVKITPAHDQNDYELGQRHKLEQISIFDEYGAVCDTGTKYDGMKRFDVRKVIIEDLKQINQYVDSVDNAMIVPMCSRSKDIIEPMLKPQWYVDVTDMAKRACDVVTNGEVKIIPKDHEKTWYRWLEDSRPWCISRQLWWGHRIPAYFAAVDGAHKESANKDDYWIVAMTPEEAKAKAAAKFGVAESKITLEQDPDVLDTWFSSALYPFSAFGWPDKTPELERFYPGHLLETGHDILFFWVARMVMFSLDLENKVPFKEIYLHAMVRDAHGRKMSKSLGNVIDPLQVINGISIEKLQASLLGGNLDDKEIKKAQAGQAADYPEGIPECGTDALRFGLCAYTAQGRDINLDVKRIEGYRKFCNKLWNAINFAQMQLGDFSPAKKQGAIGNLKPIDKWIMTRLATCAQLCNDGFAEYDFPGITTAVYNFWLYELCDVYLEAIKPIMYGELGTEQDKKVTQEVLYTCLDAALKLTAPFMPYLTEELWQRLPRRSSDKNASIHVSRYPKAANFEADPVAEAQINLMMDTIKNIRSVRGEYKLTPKQKTDVYVETKSAEAKDALEPLSGMMASLSSSGNVVFANEIPVGCSVSVVNDEVNVHIMLKGVIDFEKELKKVEKNMKDLTVKLAQLEKKMTIGDYAAKVPQNVQQADGEKCESLRSEINESQKAIDGIKQLI